MEGSTVLLELLHEMVLAPYVLELVLLPVVRLHLRVPVHVLLVVLLLLAQAVPLDVLIPCAGTLLLQLLEVALIDFLHLEVIDLVYSAVVVLDLGLPGVALVVDPVGELLGLAVSVGVDAVLLEVPHLLCAVLPLEELEHVGVLVALLVGLAEDLGGL